MLIPFVLIRFFNRSAVMLPAKPKCLWSSTSRSHTVAWKDASKWSGLDVIRNDPKICLDTKMMKNWTRAVDLLYIMHIQYSVRHAAIQCHLTLPMLNFGARLNLSPTADHGQTERINETSYKTQAQPQTSCAMAPFYLSRKQYDLRKKWNGYTIAHFDFIYRLCSKHVFM